MYITIHLQYLARPNNAHNFEVHVGCSVVQVASLRQQICEFRTFLHRLFFSVDEEPFRSQVLHKPGAMSVKAEALG